VARAQRQRAPLLAGLCWWCHAHLPPDVLVTRHYCGTRCSMAAWRRRRKLELVREVRALIRYAA
jgi:hypothetical protein